MAGDWWWWDDDDDEDDDAVSSRLGFAGW
jgi:hypothetical protein